MNESILAEKTMDFAVKIVELHKELVRKKKEYQIADQLKRSGTAIGALLCEAKYAESPADFVHKMKIALKECHETDYWLKVLHGSEFMAKDYYDEMMADVEELYRVITASIKTAKASL